MADLDNSATTTSDTPVDSGNGGGFSALSGSGDASAAAPVQTPSAAPDFTSDTPVSPSDNGPAPAPAPAPAPVKPTSKWEGILMGALQGMVGGAGQKFFGTGMAAGAANVQNIHQQQVENDQRQQQIDVQKQQLDMQKQEQPWRIKFMSAQAASMAADASIKAHQAAYFDDDHARQVEADNRATADWFMQHGFNPIAATANDGHSEKAAMEGMGTVPPTTTLQVAGNSLLHFDLSQMPQQIGLDYVNKQNAQQGKGQIDSQTWGQMPQAARTQMVYAATQYWNPTVSEDAITQYQNDRARVAAIPDSQLPDKAATLKHYDDLISGMKATMDKANARGNKQAAASAGATAYAKGYGDEKGKNDADKASGLNPDGSNPSNPGSPVNPNSNSILAQTGLSLPAFSVLTGNASQLPRDKATRTQAMTEAQKWANDHGVDVATMSSQYKALNEVLQKNVERQNNTKIMENELDGTITNMKGIASKNPVSWWNVGKLWEGKQLNDQSAQQTVFYLHQLKSELSAYFAAAQGRNASGITEQDGKDADKVINDGINSRSLDGLQSAISSSTGKMKGVMDNSVTTARQGVWDLFGVKPPSGNAQPQNGQTQAPARPAGVPTNATWNPQGNGGKGSWRVPQQ